MTFRYRFPKHSLFSFMDINYVAVLVATVLQFIVGAVWYTFIFGEAWGKIHGFEKYSKAEQEAMMKQMGPWYGLQFLITIVTTLALAAFIQNTTADWSAYMVAFVAWIGFVVPTQMSAVIFGGTEAKWMWKKMAIMAGGSLACLMTAAVVLELL